MDFDEENSWDLDELLGSDGEESNEVNFKASSVAKSPSINRTKKENDSKIVNIPNRNENEFVEDEDDLLDDLLFSDPELADNPTKSKNPNVDLLAHFMNENSDPIKRPSGELKPNLKLIHSPRNLTPRKQSAEVRFEPNRQISRTSVARMSSAHSLSAQETKIIEETETELQKQRYKSQADHLQNQVEGLKDKQRLYTEKHEMEKTNLELKLKTTEEQFKHERKLIIQNHEIELDLEVKKTQEMMQGLIDDLKKRHADEISTLQSINDSKSRSKCTSNFADQRMMAPLMEKLEASYSSLSTLKNEFTTFLTEGYKEQKHELMSEKNSLVERQKSMSQQMQSQEKLANNLNDCVDNLKMEKIELKGIETRLRLKESQMTNDFLEMQKELRKERNQFSDEKIKFEDYKSEEKMKIQRDEQYISQEKEKIRQQLHQIQLSKEKTDRELMKINLESEYSTEQKGKLDLDLENLKEDQRKFKLTKEKFESQRLEMEQKFYKSERVLAEQNRRTAELDERENKIRNDEIKLQQEKLNLERDQEKLEKDMLKVLKLNKSLQDVGVENFAPIENSTNMNFNFQPKQFNYSEKTRGKDIFNYSSIGSDLENMKMISNETREFLKKTKDDLLRYRTQNQI